MSHGKDMRVGFRGALGGLLVAALALSCGVTEEPAPIAQKQAPVSSYTEPDHVKFTLEGCRNDGLITLPNGGGKFICPAAAYTTGNLGKGWNELDLVPHKLTAAAGNAAPANQTYTIAVALDAFDAGHPGYDVISDLEAASGPCTVAVGPEMIMSPGIGGTDQTRYRLLEISQAKNTICVFDFYGRLALGSHLYPGSSLHANAALPVLDAGGVFTGDITTQGIGARDVSIPVKEILPQELSKTMVAAQGTDHVWTIAKEVSPTSVTFSDTCSTNPADRQAAVKLTVTWKKLAASPYGDIEVVSEITAINPAHRTISVLACDTIYSGTTEIKAKECDPDGPHDVPADSSVVVWTHQTTVPAGSTDLNDIAEATYIDKITGIPVPGQTSATASAEVQLSGPELNQTADVSDSETISGAGFKFSADSFAPAIGAFQGGYIAGTAVAPGPVDWKALAQSGGGSVVFAKTVYVDAATISSGKLEDTASLLGSDGASASASASVGLTASAKVSLTINKTIPNVLTGSETASFDFQIKLGGVVKDTATITFTAGQTSKSTTVTGLEPGQYVVSELQSGNWKPQDDQNVDLRLDRGCVGLACCSNSASFDNDFGPASARARKVTVPAGSEAGWELKLKEDGVVVETVTTQGTAYEPFLWELKDGKSYEIVEIPQAAWEQIDAQGCSFTVDYPADADKIFSCTLTNRFIPVGKIAPTQTTCDDFINGTVVDLLAAEYQADGTYITNATPGVFFYYTKFKAPGAACFTVDLTQSVTPASYDPSHLFEVQQEPATSQVRFYDANCGTSTLATASIPSSGQARLLVCGATAGAEYIASAKYDTKSIVGESDPGTDELLYGFSTYVNGALKDFDVDGLKLILK